MASSDPSSSLVSDATCLDTVQQQYTRGHYNIASWAHIVNAHVFPGPDIVVALKAGAQEAIRTLKQSVETEIFVGTPTMSDNGEDDEPSFEEEGSAHANAVRQNNNRPGSVVTTTTIYQTVEQPGGARMPLQGPGSPPAIDPDLEVALATLHDPPLARGLLLFAQMSSRNNLMDRSYTETCVKIAKEHPDFVMGYIAQENLNEEAAKDNFISMTPGVKMAPEGNQPGGLSNGDSLGQQYRTPEIVIKEDGCDIIIVGRGIIGARNRKKEAERYRKEAWKAYEARFEPGGSRFR
jgi:uridine monophosphate synthetase